MSEQAPVLREIGDLTAEWLEQALGCGPVDDFRTAPVGTGQMSESHRVTLDSANGPSSVVVKLAATDPTSRATGVGLGAYEREVRFYRELAPRVGGPLAECHAAVLDPDEGWFTLVLEDVAPAEQGDQIAGCDVAQASLAIRELARIHAPVFADSQLGATPWLNGEMPLNQALLTQLLPAFLERYEGQVAPEHQSVCERFVASLDGWIADRRPPLGLVHGDYRLDNMLFGRPEDGREFVIVDWQTLGWGPVMTDAAYFLGGALSVEDRRAHEEALVREYHEALQSFGVRGFSWEECWTGYRRYCFLGILMVVAPAMLVERTERGDRMFLTTLARYAQQVLDLGAIDLLPAEGAGRPAPLRPEPDDEAAHAPGPEELWNESWYFDAISDDGQTGMWARLGLYPNQGLAWVTAFVCGPNRETASLVDFEAPLPDDAGLVESGAYRLSLECDAPLERFRVVLDGEISLDLTWHTTGQPYAYRVTTRYEIPCRVTGTMRVGDEEIELRGHGQRDHSWGTRDWWSAEWMWSAGWLEDGTRFHGVEFRLPDAPRLGLGYIQPPEGGVEELDRVVASEEVTPDVRIAAATIAYGDDLALQVEPRAFGPLRLVAPDGRVTHFPRAMCEVTAPDGRRGAAWVEWNLNRSLEA